MLCILRWEDYPDYDLASKATGRTCINLIDFRFDDAVVNFDLNSDPWFRKFLLAVDRCDIPMPNVARDIETGKTHSFDRVSSGVRALWLAAHQADDWLFLGKWFGENCYQCLLDIGAVMDVLVLDDSAMLISDIQGYCMDNCHGQFQDFKRGDIYTIVPGGEVCFEFYCLEDEEV